MVELAVDAGALAPALRWIDRRFGPIRRLTPHRLGAFWLFTSDLARVPVGTLYQETVGVAAGVSLDRAEALRRSLGEAIERLSGYELPLPAQLRRSALAPALTSRWARCADDEPSPASSRGPIGAEPLLVASMTMLADGCDVDVPASFAHPVLAGAHGEPVLASGISTGLAFHRDTHAATWSALCEVLERDAVASAWWTRTPGARLVFDGREPAPLRARLREAARLGVSVTVWTLPAALALPTVLCVLRGEAVPHVTAGAACGGRPDAAVCKAIDEAVALRHYTSGANVEDGARPARPLDVTTLAEHARSYALGCWPDAFAAFDAAPPLAFSRWAGSPFLAPPPDAVALRDLARDLAQEGLTVLVRGLTTPEAAPLGRVVRVAIPELVPMSPDHRNRWLATPRLIARAGLTRSPRSADFNTYPLPLA